MLEDSDPLPSAKTLKINWAKEAAIGAVISAVFTVMASNSGTAGVTDASFAARMHDFMIIGGLVMSMVCCYATMVLVLGQVLD